MTVRTNADRIDLQAKMKLLLGVETTDEIEAIICEYFFGKEPEATGGTEAPETYFRSVAQ